MLIYDYYKNIFDLSNIAVIVIYLVYASIVLYVVWVSANKLQKIIIKVIYKFPEERRVTMFFFPNIVKACIVLLGIIILLGSLGIDITALVASLGLTGFALGFVLKDLLYNIVMGIFINLYQPFKEKQYIKIMDHTGQVDVIDWVYIHIRCKDSYVLIPNSFVLNKEIVIIDK